MVVATSLVAPIAPTGVRYPAPGSAPLTRARTALTGAAGAVVTGAVGTGKTALADRLVLSVRTVQTHLARACRKLQVRSRRELAAALAAAA
jgi:DNA-binding CsgD family transcriptional regulator